MTEKFRLYKGAWIFRDSPHKEEKLSSEQKKQLLSSGGMFVRNCYMFDCTSPTHFWYVIKDSYGGFEELSSNMRRKVRKCYQTMKVERISLDRLEKEGYEVYTAAMDAYRINATKESYENFQKRLRSGEDNDVWACFDIESGRMVAFSLNYTTDSTAEYRTLKALPEYRQRYAFYGLIHTMNQFYLEEKGMAYVCDGTRTITEHSNIQSFLIENFKFRKAYCHLDITYKWWLSLLVNCIYPFRAFAFIPSVKALLKQEAMSRGEE